MENKWNLMVQQVRSMAEEARPVSALCNILSLLYWTDESLNWAGLYILDQETLYLGPFMGRPACMQINLGSGVVGTCASRKEAMLVPDVHAFPGHIACDCASRSEAVFPLTDQGKVMAVLDIDCLRKDGIAPEMFQSFQETARILEPLVAAMAGSTGRMQED